MPSFTSSFEPPAPAHAVPPQSRRLNRWLALWATLWLLAALFGPALLQWSGVELNAHGHTHLYAHGHPFVDARSLWGVPNALDVLSNLPLLLAGGLGLWVLARGTLHAHAATRRALAVLFGGLVLTGLCSAYYHWAPDATGLVWDRLGMAVTFAGAIALAVAERVGVRSATPLLFGCLAAAVLSAAWPLWWGNVLPWAVLQFGGVALIVWLSRRLPLPGAIGVRIGVLIGLYALAKVLEMGDAAVFHATGEWVSGHSLKHVAAALAAWPVLHAMRQNGAEKERRLPVG